jgi:putative SOS response-associated peptidase YedK
MCYHTHISASIAEMEKQFMSKFHTQSSITPGRFNGFTFPKTPVITTQEPNTLQLFNWGLLPHWAKEKEFAKNTLNAKLETLQEKPSFSTILHQRCLIPANGFYEWQWLDSKGKQKQEYFIHLPDEQLFAFAGLWSKWIDSNTDEIMYTYTIITTNANELMASIHNTKKRMPVILLPASSNKWLKSGELETANSYLLGDKINQNGLQLF